MPVDRSEIYEFGRFRLDVPERQLTSSNGEASGSLPEKAFRTLVHLVRNSGTLVTSDELLAVVWPEVVVEKNNVGKAIHAIRHALGDPSDEPKFVQTVAKHGYRFIAEVTRVAGSGSSKPSAPVGDKRARVARSPAYDLYVRGKIKAGSENIEDIDDAIRLLEAAVALDPLMADAFAQLARAYNTRGFKFTSSAESKAYQDNADVALAKALDLDPDLAEAHFARGLILWTKAKGFPHAQAIRAFKRSLELDPGADETHHQLSMVYSHVGLLDEAHEHVTAAVDINPNNTMARFRLGVYAAWQCNFEGALAALKTVPRDVSPMLIDRIKAEVLVQLGRLDDAQAIVNEYLGHHPNDEGGSFTSVNAVLSAKRGRAREAERMIARAIEIGKSFGHFHHTAHNIASAYAGLNRPNEAVRWLTSAADDGFPCYHYFMKDPNLDRLRAHSGFTALMSELRSQGQRFKQIV